MQEKKLAKTTQCIPQTVKSCLSAKIATANHLGIRGVRPTVCLIRLLKSHSITKDQRSAYRKWNRITMRLLFSINVPSDLKMKTIYASAIRSHTQRFWAGLNCMFCCFFFLLNFFPLDLNELFFVDVRWIKLNFACVLLCGVSFTLFVFELATILHGCDQHGTVSGMPCRVFWFAKTHVTIRIVLQKRRSRMDFNLHSISYVHTNTSEE